MFADQVLECPNPDACAYKGRAEALAAFQSEALMRAVKLQRVASIATGDAFLAKGTGAITRSLLQRGNNTLSLAVLEGGD